MEGFEQVYRRHVHAVFRFALHCVGRRDVAEDITSEAFLALLRNFDGIDTSQLPGWLLAVVRNRARDYWRHSQVEQRHANRPAPVEATPDTPPIERMLLESTTLKPVQRACLLMRYLYGMTLDEVAQQMGMSSTQVKGHLQRGRELLRIEYASPAK